MDDWSAFSAIFTMSFFVFLEISKNRLAMLKALQATHARINFLDFCHMNHLAATCCLPGDANWFASSSYFREFHDINDA